MNSNARTDRHNASSSGEHKPKGDPAYDGKYGHLSNDGLLSAASAARGAAHRAPFAEWSKDHTGHSAIVHHTTSWAERGHAFVDLMTECRRRGLAMPPCDCPPGSHDGRAVDGNEAR